MENKAKQLIKEINNLGYEAYAIGGCVRDRFLGLDPHDYDFTTNCPVEILEKKFRCFNIGNSKDFGITSVIFKGTAFEVAQYREDVHTGNENETGGVRIVKELSTDVSRRDFTINALAFNADGKVIDFVGGVRDIECKLIRAVGVPDLRIKEDYIRMLRAARFAARLGFDIEINTKEAIQENARKIVHVAKERIQQELYKAAENTGEVFARYIEILDELGLLKHVLHEVKDLQDVFENHHHHPEAFLYGNGSVYHHVLHALRQNKEKNHLINLCVLFHDLGKAVTGSVKEDGITNTYRGHDVVSVEIIDQISKRLKFSGADEEIFKYAAEKHMQLFHIKKVKKSTVVRFGIHPLYPYLKATVFCDDTCREGACDLAETLETFRYIEHISATFKPRGNERVKIVDGNIVKEITGLPQGRVLGKLIKTVEEEILNMEEYVCIKSIIFKHLEK